MSDAGTDRFVGVVLVLAAVVAVVASVNGESLTAPTGGSAPSASRTSPASGRPAQSSTNIPGGTLFACGGDVIADETAGRGSNAVNLKIYYSPTAGGRNCAVATKVDTSSRRKGPMTVTLRFAESKSTSWPQLARHRSNASATRSGAVYLDDTDDRCVRAEARFTPADGGKAVTVNTGRTGCD